MRRAEFVKIRTRQGKHCGVSPRYRCWDCACWVEQVVTRDRPPQYILFDAGELGRIHDCPARGRDARRA
jgi:hypothetical protein